MNEKVKLIIEIPKETYKTITADKYAIYDKMYYSIKNGIPLDDVKAEIDKAQEPYKTSTAYDEGVRFGLMLAYQIVDKYKAVYRPDQWDLPEGEKE